MNGKRYNTIMKKYRLNEEEDSFKIITEEGNKDIIVNGVSVYEKYFKPLDIKIERIVHNPEFPEIYICTNERYSDKECNIVVSSKDGGKICDHVFKKVYRYALMINGKMTPSPSWIRTKAPTRPTTVERPILGK
jgi:hypothetical protein